MFYKKKYCVCYNQAFTKVIPAFTFDAKILVKKWL